MLNLILFGPPGAGKGTQSEKLINGFQLAHLSTGNILRAEVAAQTPLGVEAKKIMDAGKLVPDTIIIGMVERRLREDSKRSDIKGFIFDGFPRTVAQAEALDKMLAEHEMSMDAMLMLDVPENELVTRLLKRAELQGRTDDNEATIKQRLATYKEETLPVAAYYQQQNKLHTVEGVGEIQAIYERLKGIVDGIKQ